MVDRRRVVRRFWHRQRSRNAQHLRKQNNRILLFDNSLKADRADGCCIVKIKQPSINWDVGKGTVPDRCLKWRTFPLLLVESARHFWGNDVVQIICPRPNPYRQYSDRGTFLLARDDIIRGYLSAECRRGRLGGQGVFFSDLQQHPRQMHRHNKSNAMATTAAVPPRT